MQISAFRILDGWGSADSEKNEAPNPSGKGLLDGLGVKADPQWTLHKQLEVAFERS